MNVYYLVFFVTFLIQFVPVKDQKGYIWRLFFTFLPLFLYAALREDFGYDYLSYENIYKYADNRQSFWYQQEEGFMILNRLMPTFRSLIVVTSAFTCLVYGVFFYRYIPIKYSWLAILLLFFAGDKTIFFMLSGLRNAISVSILLLSLSLIEKRKILWFVGYMFLAAQFHRTAFIFFPIAYLIGGLNEQMTKKELFVWLGIFVIVLIFSSSMLFKYVNLLLENDFFGKYSQYEDRFMAGDNRGGLLMFAIIVLFGGLLYIINSYKLSKISNIIFRLALMFIFSYALGTLNMRVSQHFIMFFILTIVYVFAYVKNDLVKYGFVIFSLLFLGYAFFVVFVGSSTFPYEIYHSILD